MEKGKKQGRADEQESHHHANWALLTGSGLWTRNSGRCSGHVFKCVGAIESASFVQSSRIGHRGDRRTSYRKEC